MRALALLLGVILTAADPGFAQPSGNPFLGGGPVRQAPADRPAPTRTQAAPLAPLVEVDFPEQSAIPGQELTLRLTVLVPTFMPKPPQWPGFEAPNLLVRLPERASSPTSRSIGGASWSGITRQYRLTPLIPGDFHIPAQEVAITWSDPDGGPARDTRVAIPAVAFRGVVPEGAEGLEPFIAARDLTLEQEIEGASEELRPGDSLTRVVTARVTGVAPMILPPLVPPAGVTGLTAYPDDPVVARTETGRELGGFRSERVVYLAEGGGAGMLPEVVLDWYDVDAGRVVQARLPGVEIRIDGPPAAAAYRATPKRMAFYGGLAAVALAVSVWVARRMCPVVRRFVDRRRRAYRASERFAWKALTRAASQRDHAGLRPALDLWAERVPGRDPRRNTAVRTALLTLGAERFGGAEATGDPWAAFNQALTQARREGRARPGNSDALPPLNPTSSRS